MTNKNPKPEIAVFNNHPDFQIDPAQYQEIIEHFLQWNPLPAKSLSLIFVSDGYLRELHRRYLNDDSYSDVMTFNLGEQSDIEGEIYISLDRAKIQAEQYEVDLETEIARLIIHGLLHLQGYDDRTEAERLEMHRLENQYLEKIRSVLGKE